MLDRATKSYGCVRCQQWHYDDEPVYEAHIGFQSKHGVRQGVSDDEWKIVLQQRWERSLAGCHCCDCGEPLTHATAMQRPTANEDVYELVHVDCALNRTENR